MLKIGTCYLAHLLYAIFHLLYGHKCI